MARVITGVLTIMNGLGFKKYIAPTSSVSSNQEEKKKKKSKQELKMKVLQTLAEMSNDSESCASP